MSVPKRPSREQEVITLSQAHAQVTATTGPTKFWKNKTGRQLKVTSVQYLNPTGLAQDASNTFDIALKQGSVVVAHWDTTTTTGQGTITADTHMNMVLSSTPADLIIEPDEVLSLLLTETGTATLPAGQIEVTGLLL